MIFYTTQIKYIILKLHLTNIFKHKNDYIKLIIYVIDYPNSLFFKINP